MRGRTSAPPTGRTVPPEQAVLLACALADRRRASAILAQRLSDVREWGALHDAALHHGVVALLSRLFVECGPDVATVVPPAELASLRVLAAANERRNLRLSARLLRVLELLAGAGLETLSVKGPVMAEALYGDVGLRQFADLDIAVRARDVDVACEALLGQGFRQITGVGIAIDRLLASEGGVAFDSPDGELVLDLHWRLGPRFAHASLPAEALMAKARRVRFLGRDVVTPSLEDLFIVLCVHGSHNHRWDRLELVAALGACGAALDDAAWSPLLDRAARFGCLRRCIIGMLLMRDVTGRALPLAVDARIGRDALAGHLARAAREALFADGLEPPTQEGLGGIVWESLALDRPTTMAAHFVARVLTPGIHDWGAGGVPPRWPALYYLTRPARLASRHLRRGGAG